LALEIIKPTNQDPDSSGLLDPDPDSLGIKNLGPNSDMNSPKSMDPEAMNPNPHQYLPDIKSFQKHGNENIKKSRTDLFQNELDVGLRRAGTMADLKSNETSMRCCKLK
jgi:hypothetical protein